MRLLAILTLAVFLAGQAKAETITAVLEPARVVDLRSTVNGRVARLDLNEGDRVEAGMILAEIDARVQSARVALAEVVADASGATLRAERLLDQAATLRDRVAEARRKGAAQAWELTAAEQALAVAEADAQMISEDLERRKAELQLEQATLAEFSIEAPFQATILEVMVEPGEIVDTGTVLMSIGTISSLTSTAFVPVSWLEKLERGSELSSETEFGDRVVARVKAIDPRVDPASRTIRVVLSLDNAEGAYLPGTTLNIEAP